jgi:hypothetical protein
MIWRNNPAIIVACQLLGVRSRGAFIAQEYESWLENRLIDLYA